MLVSAFRCFCKAVDAFNNGRILKDLGTVETHNHWLMVGCGKLANCANTCDRIVQQWVCTRKAECDAAAGDALVRSHYTASVCKSGAGHVVRKCGACGFGGLPGKAPTGINIGDIKQRLRANGLGAMV